MRRKSWRCLSKRRSRGQLWTNPIKSHQIPILRGPAAFVKLIPRLGIGEAQLDSGLGQHQVSEHVRAYQNHLIQRVQASRAFSQRIWRSCSTTCQKSFDWMAIGNTIQYWYYWHLLARASIAALTEALLPLHFNRVKPIYFFCWILQLRSLVTCLESSGLASHSCQWCAAACHTRCLADPCGHMHFGVLKVAGFFVGFARRIQP